MKKEVTMKVINPSAAGIDVGSRSHFVAIGQQAADVREFGVYTQDHYELIEWLNQHGITSIAMESTGSYWQTLFSALQRSGFEVLLVNGKQIKNVKGKTDVKDCQWIQRLHSLGLLTGSFLPSQQMEQLRTYQRHRSWLVEQCAKMSNKMQKSLRLMNIRLDVVLSDITGKSGQAIIGAILQGVRDGDELAALSDHRIKRSKQELAQSLQGQWTDELIFELRDCFELYHLFQERIFNCDKQIEALLKGFVKDLPAQDQKLTKKKSYRNQQKFDLPKLSHQYFGVDLFAIQGVSHGTVMTFIAEVGNGIFNFKTAKHFTSWLHLAPDNKISGSKILSSRTPKGKNKMAIALRNAANAIGLMKSGTLKKFFSRIAYKKGRAAAITATARKLAVIIWNMVVKGQKYSPIEEHIYDNNIRASIISNIRKKVKRLNLSLEDLSTALFSS
jgi:transposase